MSMQVICFASSMLLALGMIRRAPRRLLATHLLAATAGSEFPSGVLVDVIDFSNKDEPCKMNEAQDFGSILKSKKCAVVFAVPGAYTPTCSAQVIYNSVSLHPMRERKNNTKYLPCNLSTSLGL